MENLEIGLEIVTKSLTSVEKATSIILENIPTLSSHEVPIINAFGRTLSQAVIAKISNPPEDVSSMDGYAIRNKDLKLGIKAFSIIDESIAGKKSIKTIGSGETIRIFTGAVLPDGSDRIIIQEDVNFLSNKKISINEKKLDKSNFFVRKKGSDFKSNENLLEEGEILNARKLSLAVASGNTWAEVRNKPRIAILSTGDELIKFGDLTNHSIEDKIISSNGIFLHNFINELGGEAFYLPTAKDNLESLSKIFQNANNYDLIITTGGASVGDYDLVQTALNKDQFELFFWKIAMRPGKPVFFGKLSNTPLLGLPGNPVSTGVCAMIFLKKIIQKFLGQKIHEDIDYMILNSNLDKNDHRQDYIRSKIIKNPNGNYTVEPFLKQDSSQISIFSKSDCFIIRKPHQNELKKGSKVPVLKPNNNI